MDGILRCSRYAFGPNRLHYCGPDANQEILAYMEHGMSDPGLETLLKAFQTMYPYLTHIAEANGIRDPFDERVVEAYWLGNELLENIEMKKFFRHLREDHKIEKRIGQKSFELISDKIRQGALPHHSFHVLDIWKRTGHLEVPHTLESMDECRISWGEVLAVDGPAITVEYEPLVIEGGKLALGSPVQKKILRPLESDVDIEQLRVGDIISMHWGVICEVISPHQASTLKKYTSRHIRLANQTL